VWRGFEFFEDLWGILGFSGNEGVVVTGFGVKIWII
jgi:hypothetical protein